MREARESDKERLSSIESELTELRSDADAYRERWRAEVETIQALRSLKESLEDTKHAQLEAERGGNLEKAAELKYGRLPELEKEISHLTSHVSKPMTVF